MKDDKPTAMLIEANFDIDQIGETLEWQFSRKDGHGNPIKGRYAGSVYFTVGEVTRVRIKAGGYSKFTGFEVLDCTLITRPQIVETGAGLDTIFASPSPFVSTSAIKVNGATVSLPPEQFVDLPVQGTDPDYTEFAREWNQELTVGAKTGRWEFSFVLTVAIKRLNAVVPELRVFTFDPEGEVGSGVSPPRIKNTSGAMPEPMPMAMLFPEGEVGSGVSPPRKSQF